MTSRRKVVFSIQILNITFVAHLKKSYFLLSNIHGGATRKKVVFAWIKWPGVAREQECSYGGGGNTRGSGGSGWFPDDRQALFRTLRANHDFFPNSALAFLNTGCFQKFLGTVPHSETLLLQFPFSAVFLALFTHFVAICTQNIAACSEGKIWFAVVLNYMTFCSCSARNRGGDY